MVTKQIKVEQGYERVFEVLQKALDQTQSGKGKERHSRGTTPFERQPIVEIAHMVGPAGPAFQVIKKTQESMRLPPDRAIAELLGAIIYAAATIIAIEDKVAEMAPFEVPKEAFKALGMGFPEA